ISLQSVSSRVERCRASHTFVSVGFIYKCRFESSEISQITYVFQRALHNEKRVVSGQRKCTGQDVGLRLDIVGDRLPFILERVIESKDRIGITDRGCKSGRDRISRQNSGKRDPIAAVPCSVLERGVSLRAVEYVNDLIECGQIDANRGRVCAAADQIFNLRRNRGGGHGEIARRWLALVTGFDRAALQPGGCLNGIMQAVVASVIAPKRN